MRKLIKHIASLVLIPLTRWYLRKERSYRYNDISVRILPGVFHPGFFVSSRFLLSFLAKQDLKGSTFLDVGSGSGILSVMAARKGANVTAIDLSPEAINNSRLNANRNSVSINVIQSDLFDNLKNQKFDWIVINPPFYARRPENDADRAWYCGENFEYFTKLFSSLNSVIHSKTCAIMVLTKGAKVEQIVSIGASFGFELKVIQEKNVFFDEKHFLFRILAK